MLYRLDNYDYGYNVLTEMDGKHKEMMMDIGIYKFRKDEKIKLKEPSKEMALLLLEGTVIMKWNGIKHKMERHSLFDDEPWCLHLPRNLEVEVEALEESEVLIQKTDNDRAFEPKLYTPEDCKTEIFGEEVLGESSRRLVRTIFDYKIAPYSNMVIGEVINLPGRWSSYPPHHHPQPEVYLYRFTKPQGFGAAFVGDEVYKVVDNSFLTIPGGYVHPQVTAPGYGMYYCWMIRHLDGNPWTDRVMDEDHSWLLDPKAEVWSGIQV